MGHYHDTVPFAKNNFAKAAKSAASKCNIERHPLLETASRNYSTHQEWHASLWRTRRSARQLFAQLRSLVAVTRGPFFRIVSMWLARSQLTRRRRPNREFVGTALRRLAPPQRLPHRLHHRRHPRRFVQNPLPPHLPQLSGRLLRHPPRPHHHLGVQPAPRLEQPPDDLRGVQVRQTVVEHDQRRLPPPDLEQRVHPRRRLHHLHVQIGPLDRQHHRLQVARVVVHHHHHVVPVPPLELRGHRHLVRVQKRREILRLHTPAPRRCLVPLQHPLADPVRYRRGRDLTDARHALRAPVSLVLWQTHRTPNNAKMRSAQGGMWTSCNSRWRCFLNDLITTCWKECHCHCQRRLPAARRSICWLHPTPPAPRSAPCFP